GPSLARLARSAPSPKVSSSGWATTAAMGPSGIGSINMTRRILAAGKPGSRSEELGVDGEPDRVAEYELRRSEAHVELDAEVAPADLADGGELDADAIVSMVRAGALEADLQAHRLRDATDGDEAVHHVAVCAGAVDARRVERHRGMGLGIETRGHVEECVAVGLVRVDGREIDGRAHRGIAERLA